MTDKEFKYLCDLIETVDNGCPNCVDRAYGLAEKMFPGKPFKDARKEWENRAYEENLKRVLKTKNYWNTK